MTDAEKYAKVFRAASEGHLRPFHRNGAQWSGNAYQEAECRAGSFDAIAEIFEAIAMTENPEARS